MVILTSFPPPTEGVRVEQANTSAYVGSTCFGNGTLYIAESRLSWVGTSGRGFSLEYPAISLHAISRDRRLHPDECLYMMIDADLQATSKELVGNGAVAASPAAVTDTPPCEENADDDDDDQDEDDEDIGMTEIRFVPEDKGVLDAFFHAMSECQALHPDPEEAEPEDTNESDEDGDEDYDGDEEAIFQGLTAGLNGTTLHGATDMASSGNVRNGAPMDTSQFEDAESEN